MTAWSRPANSNTDTAGHNNALRGWVGGGPCVEPHCIVGLLWVGQCREHGVDRMKK